MALRTVVTDAGTDHPRPIRWGWWHVECIVATIRADLGEPDLDFFEALGRTPHTVVTTRIFTDPADGEVFTLSSGDTLDAWRDR